jgi:hypothetical protein
MTLAETVKTFRSGAKLIGLGALLLLAGRILLRTFPIINPRSQPTPTPVPQVGFGKLPSLEIPSLQIDPASPPTYVLDLISAVLPQTPLLADVLPIAEPSLGLLTAEKAQAIAARFNFSQSPDLSSDYYTWKNRDEELRVEKESLNVFYSYLYGAHPEIFIPASFYSTSQATDLAQKILKDFDLNWGLEESKPRYELLKLSGENLVKAESLRETSAVRVDFPQPLINNYPMVTENFDQALVYVIFTADPGSRQNYSKLLKLQKVRWSISSEEASSYSLKSSQEAWQELQQTGKHLVKLLPKGADPFTPYTIQRVKEFRVREVYIAYYYSRNYQEYLQPVWVFKGEAVLVGLDRADWAAYIPAVKSDLIE